MTDKKEHDLDAMCGSHISQVAEELVALAAEKGRRVTADFNGFELFAVGGMSVGDVVGAYDAYCSKQREEYERKRREFEATIEGQRQRAEAHRKADEEKRLQSEASLAVAASGLRESHPWRDGMLEISGFGGGYEVACRTMMYAGLLWLLEHPDADARGTDRDAFQKAIVRAEPGCSGAMFGAAASHAFFIRENGYEAWAERMTKPPKATP